MGHEFHKIWIEQCAAAERIRDDFGTRDALNYLVGEKLVDFVDAAHSRSEFAAERPHFVARVRSIFDRLELQGYFDDPDPAGPLVPRYSDEELRSRDEEEDEDDIKEALSGDPVTGAERILVLERVKELLLG